MFLLLLFVEKKHVKILNLNKLLKPNTDLRLFCIIVDVDVTFDVDMTHLT